MANDAAGQIRSFPPLEAADTRVLVLGTMPGEASLRAGRYYAHPRNAFWPIMIALATGRHRADRDHALALSYDERVRLLADAGFAVWDVLAQCERRGSLDTAIRSDTLVPNAIGRLVARQPSLATIAFNGRKAEALFARHVAQALASAVGDRALVYRSLPSTSPAMARLSLDAKFERWHAALADRPVPPATGRGRSVDA